MKDFIMQESRQQAALLAAKLMNLYDPSLPATIPVKRITENYESCDEHFRKLFDISKYFLFTIIR